MKKTIPFYLIQSVALVSLLALTACSTPPKSYKKPDYAGDTYTPKIKPAKQAPPLKPEDLTSLSDSELERKIANTQQQAHWPNFILLNHQLWQNARSSEQAQIEQRIWDTLSQQPLADIKHTIKILKKSPARSVQQWGALLAVLKGPAKDLPKGVARLNKSNSDAIYMHHLLPGINLQNRTSNTPKQIAVLLPFEGKYEHISNQIKTGIMKAYMVSDQKTKLTFHNSSNLETLESTYQKAKQAGADFVIGPLRKEAIERLLTIADENVLALNKIDYAPFTQFSYKSANEVSQLIKHLKTQNYQHIGILSNDSPSDLKMAHAIENGWNQTQGHSSFLSVYPNQKPKLRQALGELINEAKSKERYNTLRWATGYKLSFFPRTRQDFDAIIIIDKKTRMAVFKPQFVFFNLKTPIYGTSKLSPKKLQKIKRDRDLKGVKFLARPAIFNAESLKSNFEAFGWDSFQIATQLHNLNMGGYLASGKTGELTLNNQLIQQHFVWAKYNKKGIIVPFKPTETTK